MRYQTPRVAGLRARFTFLLIGASLGCAMGAGVAGAATADSDAPSLVVRFSPASLATDRGVRDLYHRIVAASKQVCVADGVPGLRASQLVEACRERAVSRAIQQINNTQLAALHSAGSKNS